MQITCSFEEEGCVHITKHIFSLTINILLLGLTFTHEFSRVSYVCLCRIFRLHIKLVTKQSLLL